MGLMDKVKKILFDEDEVEIPIDNEELPERPPKKPRRDEIVERQGFIDYHNDEPVEEDTIKEVIVPKDEEEMEPKSSFNFPVDFDFEPEPARTRYHEPVSEPVKPPVYERPVEKRRDYKIEEPVIKPKEEKDYKKYINNDEKNDKKPFKATPIISPVYGILDKNYTPDDVQNRSDVQKKQEPQQSKVRTFGPVSYNDQPLPVNNKKELKEDLKELNSTISELINDSVTQADIPVRKKEIQDEITTSGIENEYIGNNNIEDAFETTSEFDKITEHDSYASSAIDDTKDIEPSVNIDDLIKDTDSEENLDNTIETDLFNLIDSMYKSDEENSEEQ